MIGKIYRNLEVIMYKPFRGLNWYQKIIGAVIFIPIVYAVVAIIVIKSEKNLTKG